MELNWTQKGKAGLIQLPTVVDGEDTAGWDALSTKWLMEPVSTYIFDFGLTVEVKPAALRLLLGFCQRVEVNGKRLASVNVKPSLARLLRGLGLDRRFCFVATEAEALALAEQPDKPSVNVQFLNLLIESTRHVMNEDAATPCSSLKPQILKGGELALSKEIAVAGLITVNSVKFRGTFAIAFPRSVFLKVCANMKVEKSDEIFEDLTVQASELLAKIYERVKAQTNKGKAISLPGASPIVIAGDAVNLRATALVPVLVIPFQMAVGNFQVEIALEAPAA